MDELNNSESEIFQQILEKQTKYINDRIISNNTDIINPNYYGITKLIAEKTLLPKYLLFLISLFS